MGLRAQAAADLKAILEDSAGGFGWPITVTDPEGVSVSMTGLSTDISESIDPNTGQAVSGRHASVVLRISAFTEAGLGLPAAVSDRDEKPWLVAFDDINGKSFQFKVAESRPDRAIGAVVCILEKYR